MSENKTKEEIIWEHTANSEYPAYYHESDIELMMTKFANQEKRSTAIAFAEFMADYLTSDYEIYYHRKDGDKPFSQAPLYKLPEIYELFIINSL